MKAGYILIDSVSKPKYPSGFSFTLTQERGEKKSKKFYFTDVSM